jgi:RNA polymerase sigma-70 factor (ECF subfamily)
MRPTGKLLVLRRAAPDPEPGEGTGAAAIGAAPEAISDETLLAACAAGDGAALGTLFDRHSRMIFRFLSRVVTADAADVEDLAQQTFLEAWRVARKYRGVASVKSWLLGIAANVARHAVRGEMRRRRVVAGLAEASAIAASPAGPDAAAEHAEQLQRLIAAMAQLPYDLRVALYLRELEGLSSADAARVLGVREGTLSRRVHDARHRLRALLDGGAP